MKWSPTCSVMRRFLSSLRRWSATCGRLPRLPFVPNTPTPQPPSPVCKVRPQSYTNFAFPLSKLCMIPIEPLYSPLVFHYPSIELPSTLIQYWKVPLKQATDWSIRATKSCHPCSDVGFSGFQFHFFFFFFAAIFSLAACSLFLNKTFVLVIINN